MRDGRGRDNCFSPIISWLVTFIVTHLYPVLLQLPLTSFHILPLPTPPHRHQLNFILGLALTRLIFIGVVITSIIITIFINCISFLKIRLSENKRRRRKNNNKIDRIDRIVSIMIYKTDIASGLLFCEKPNETWCNF